MQTGTQNPASAEGKHCTIRSFTRLQIIKNVIVICAGVLLLFSSYDGLTMMQSTMNKEQGIGVWSQAIMYFFFSISAIFFPKYFIRKFGTKNTYVLSMVLHLPYIASNFYSNWFLVVPASILIGLAGSLFWGSQATYLNTVAVMYVNLDQNSNEQNVAEKNISSIFNNITVWSSKKKDDSMASCDLATSEPYFNNDKKNVILKSYESFWSKNNSIDGGVPNLVMESSSNVISQQNGHKDTNDQFYSVPFRNDEFRNAVEDNETNRKENTSTKSPEVAKSSEDARMRRKLVEATIAQFFGYHGVAYLTTRLWGNLTTYFILQSDLDMDVVKNSSCACGAYYCSNAFDCVEENVDQPSDRIKYILTGTCVCIAVVAVLIVFFFLDQLETDRKEVTYSMDLLTATYKLAKKKKVILLIPASFYIGMVQGFFTGDFTKSFVGCAWGTYHVGLVAVSYGTSSGISSFLSGWLVRRVNRVPVFTVASLVSIAACIVMLSWNPTSEEPTMFFVIASLWGVHVGAIWSQLRAFYGVLFRKEDEAAFAAFHVWYALGYSLSFAYATYFCTYVKIYILIVVCTLGYFGYLAVEIMRYKSKFNK